MIEFWRAGGSESTTSVAAARQVEAEGWDGQMFMDSQSLCADPFVRMGAWAVATERLKLCTGVTNPATRHPAVLAACAASVQSISGGRTVLGIGRGDSALAYLGHAPMRLKAFEKTLRDIQVLLSGGEVALDAFETPAHAPSVDTISLGDKPAATRLKWLPKALPKVPLDVAATGPKVIEMSASIAERLTFSVGAIPERIAWAVDLARASRERWGTPKDIAGHGAQIIVVCHPHIETIQNLATRFVAPLARFQVIQGEPAGPLTESDKENFALIRRGYDMNKHGDHHDKVLNAPLTWNFVERFAVVGQPERCIERLLELNRLGIERFVIVGPGFYPEAEPGRSLFADEVMPAVRAAAADPPTIASEIQAVNRSNSECI
jgi:5,10-methylenetetrahydromethanopterin reductase